MVSRHYWIVSCSITKTLNLSYTENSPFHPGWVRRFSSAAWIADCPDNILYLSGRCFPGRKGGLRIFRMQQHLRTLSVYGKAQANVSRTFHAFDNYIRDTVTQRRCRTFFAGQWEQCYSRKIDMPASRFFIRSASST